MLGDIRTYLKQRGPASLSEIATRFDVGTEAAKLALDYWINKGKIQTIAPPCDSGSCNGCAGVEQLYQWIGPEKRVQWYQKYR